MPIYEEEGRLTRDDLIALSKNNKCKECGAQLDVLYDLNLHKAFLACHDWRRTNHEGIERDASRYEMEGLASLNIPKRREIMEQEYGGEKTKALARLPMTGALTQPQAMEILKLVYPNVPEHQIVRTAILCRDFGLHPLMKEVYIIGFKNKQGGIDYSTVIGITANRKMAADKKGAYSFLDDSPRAASQEEIIKQYGMGSDEERNNLISICKLKGEKGNEVTGFGLYPKDDKPYGMDKGNTPRNMANIRSERQALDRLPGEALPLRDIEVIDTTFTELPDIGKVNTETGEIVEGKVTEVKATPVEVENTSERHWCEEHNCEFERKVRGSSAWYAHKLPGGKWCNEVKKTSTTKEESGPVDDAPERDPDTIKTLNELYKACNEDFKLQPDQVIKELGVSSQSDIADTPADCYRKILEVR